MMFWLCQFRSIESNIAHTPSLTTCLISRQIILPYLYSHSLSFCPCSSQSSTFSNEYNMSNGRADFEVRTCHHVPKRAVSYCSTKSCYAHIFAHQFPDFCHFPPFYTIQPVLVTREKQLAQWRELILKYRAFVFTVFCALKWFISSLNVSWFQRYGS